jgi:hypothetical protein
MVAVTVVALTIIRCSYFKSLGPDPDRRRLHKHFLIELTEVAAHVFAAAGAVALYGRFNRERASAPREKSRT